MSQSYKIWKKRPCCQFYHKTVFILTVFCQKKFPLKNIQRFSHINLIRFSILKVLCYFLVARERRNSDSAIDDIKKDDLYTINIPRYRSLDSIRVPFEKLGILPTVADIRRKYKAKSTQATKQASYKYLIVSYLNCFQPPF